MDSIAKTFKKHSYHIDYLNAKTSEETIGQLRGKDPTEPAYC